MLYAISCFILHSYRKNRFYKLLSTIKINRYSIIIYFMCYKNDGTKINWIEAIKLHPSHWLICLIFDLFLFPSFLLIFLFLRFLAQKIYSVDCLSPNVDDPVEFLSFNCYILSLAKKSLDHHHSKEKEKGVKRIIQEKAGSIKLCLAR